MWTYKRSWRNKANSGHSSFVEGISFFICKSSWYVVEQCALMVDGVIRARRHVHLYLRHIALWKTSTGAPVTVKPHHSCIKPERFPFEVAPFSFYNFYFFPATLMLALWNSVLGLLSRMKVQKWLKTDNFYLYLYIYILLTIWKWYLAYTYLFTSPELWARQSGFEGGKVCKHVLNVHMCKQRVQLLYQCMCVCLHDLLTSLEPRYSGEWGDLFSRILLSLLFGMD